MPIGKKKLGRIDRLLILISDRCYSCEFRWVRFEEIAESVLGRWSKPHVATLMQTSLLDLKALLSNGVILLNVQPADLASLSRRNSFFFEMRRKQNCFVCLEMIVQGLIDKGYIDDVDNAQKLSWILGLPHFHHHEKRSVTKTASSISLSKQGLPTSPSFIISNLSRRGLIHDLCLFD